MKTSLSNTTERIAELLFERDCLVVPGLGAFVSNRQPAIIDRQRGMVFPPRKEIAFNRSLSHNDGVLIGYMAEQYGVTIEEANEMVCSYVDEVKRQLKNNGVANLEGVGSLRSIGLELYFVADRDVNFLMDSYGFTAQPLQFTPSVSETHARNIGQLRRVAASVAILVGLMMVAPETKDVAVDKGLSQAGIAAEMLNRPLVETVVDGGSASLSGESDGGVRISVSGGDYFAPSSSRGRASDGIKATNGVSPDAMSEADADVKVGERFYIIVGSFKTEAEADVYISAMNARGVSGLEKLPAKGRYRVSAGCFTDHAEAVRNNRTFHNIKGFEKAWVLRQKS